MSDHFILSVKFTRRSQEILEALGFNITWSEFMQDYEFKSMTPPIIFEDVADTIVCYFEETYKMLMKGQAEIQCQVYEMWPFKGEEELDFFAAVKDFMEPGGTVVVGVYALSTLEPPRWNEQTLETVRTSLRFGLKDRVLCNCGPRWLSGEIIGTAVPGKQEIIPYLVKTDPLPGLPSVKISAPNDSEQSCVQEVCFDIASQLPLVKAAARVVLATDRPKLRFEVGARVRIRVRNDPLDGLEQWVAGTVAELWPWLHGEKSWRMDSERFGNYPNHVPYRIRLSQRWTFCHRDDHTLIRREGMQPFTRVKGISQRMEVRTCEDGSEERIDHVTERRKRMLKIEPSDTE